MQHIQDAIEQACYQVQQPNTMQAGLSTLQAFRFSQNPLAACRHILDHSHQPDAKFQAASTLTHAAMREWTLMDAATRRSLRSYLVSKVLQGGSLERVVKRATALILKRGWAEEAPEERNAFFQDVEGAVATSGHPAARCAGIEILEAVVSEFAPSTATPLGLPWDFHERCRAALEAGYLQTFYAHAQRLAGEASGAAVQGQDGGTCVACIRLMNTILGWDFRPNSGISPSSVSQRLTNESLQVQPGTKWRALLLAPAATEWLHGLLLQLQRPNLDPPAQRLAAAAQALTVRLASLSGDVFPKQPEGGQQPAKLQHLQRMLGMVMLWVQDSAAAVHQAAAGDETQLLDACRALAGAAPVHKAAGFDAASPANASGPGILNTMVGLTRAHAPMSQLGLAAGDSRGFLQLPGTLLPRCSVCWWKPFSGMQSMVQPTTKVLADPGDGETPLMPIALMNASAACVAAGQGDVCEQASQRLLEVCTLALQPHFEGCLSSRFNETCTEAVARWADTYLLPAEETTPAMAQAFGRVGGGAPVLDALAGLANRLLTADASEVDLHTAVCMRLLPVLVGRRSRCLRLVQLHHWQQLAGAFAQQAAAVTALREQLQRQLACCLCAAAVGFPEAAEVQSYITHIMQGVAGDLQRLTADASQLAARIQRADVAHHAASILERLRGAALGTTSQTQPVLFAMFAGLLQPLLVVQAAARKHEGLTVLVIKLAADFVESQISYLTARQAEAVCQWVLQLLQQYSRHHLGERSVQLSQRLQQEAVADSYRDLRALLQLVTNVLQRDLLDFSDDSDSGESPVDVAQARRVVFLGLETLLPLMSLELLKFPKLSCLYFQLLAHMLETLEIGVASNDREALLSSLEAVASLGRHDYELCKGGQPGVQAAGVLATFVLVLVL
eukprot:jgi/Astpho2/9020/fgenesh1_pg.00133_%23_51_t